MVALKVSGREKHDDLKAKRNSTIRGLHPRTLNMFCSPRNQSPTTKSPTAPNNVNKKTRQSSEGRHTRPQNSSQIQSTSRANSRSSDVEPIVARSGKPFFACGKPFQ